jgi:hypothetical protein
VRLRAERVATVKQLAAIRLDVLRRGPIVTSLDAAERRALALLSEGQQAMANLEARLAKAEADNAAAQADQRAKAEEVGQALAALEKFQAEAEPRIKGGQAWRGQQALVERAASVAAEAERKAGQAETDREAKRKPYEADPLFIYLWNRKFGTADYAAGAFVRFFDRQVAELVDYAKARPNYYMLNTIPARLRDHAERCKAALTAERDKLAAIEAEGLKSAGSGPLEDALAAARAELGAAETRLKQMADALAALDRERQAAIADRQGSAWTEAVDVLAEADGRADVRELEREAAETPTAEDDALVRRISAIDAQAETAESNVQRLLQAASALARRRAELEHERDAFRQRGYDNPYGQFGNEQVIGQVLGGILKGAIAGHVLGQVLQGGYHQRQPQADSNFGGDGGFTFPFPQGGGGGGGGDSGPWGGGGDQSSGGGDGDGFSTGGSF